MNSLSLAFSILIASASMALAEPKEVILTYRDGEPAADVEILLQYASSPSAFRIRTDQQVGASFDRKNFAQLHVIYSRGDERLHFHVNAARLQWPFAITLPASSNPNTPRLPFALTDGRNRPLSIQSFEYFVGDRPGPQTPASSIAQILPLAPAKYQSLDIHAENHDVFVRLSQTSFENGGTLKLGIANSRSR